MPPCLMRPSKRFASYSGKPMPISAPTMEPTVAAHSDAGQQTHDWSGGDEGTESRESQACRFPQPIPMRRRSPHRSLHQRLRLRAPWCCSRARNLWIPRSRVAARRYRCSESPLVLGDSTPLRRQVDPGIKSVNRDVGCHVGFLLTLASASRGPFAKTIVSQKKQTPYICAGKLFLLRKFCAGNKSSDASL